MIAVAQTGKSTHKTAQAGFGTVKSDIPMIFPVDHTIWGPSSLAKLMQITIITIVYGTQMTIFRWGYKPTYITGGPHPVSYPNNFD